MKLYLDPGHGGKDPGAEGNGLREKDITLDIAMRLRDILLNDYEKVEMKLSRTSDVTKSLSARSSEANAWGADLYLSIHMNAADRSACGYEDYIYSGLSNSSKAANYQKIIHDEVIKMNRLKDRGLKKANFHVLRETTMPALLTENGFISNSQDAVLMKQPSWRQNVAQGHANGLAIAFQLQKKKNYSPVPTIPIPGKSYKIIAGSFQSFDNAKNRVTALQAKGFKALVETANISGDIWYRAQAGVFSNRENAEQRMAHLKKSGFKDVFILT
ncbi:N-acetylmuramoyl-L-alanine amidase [Bacillus sp. X1(2014)]|nr:N-acetylmuramoyl-L-alanine amidase [Bacillus sp. X1(2014)]